MFCTFMALFCSQEMHTSVSFHGIISTQTFLNVSHLLHIGLWPWMFYKDQIPCQNAVYVVLKHLLSSSRQVGQCSQEHLLDVAVFLLYEELCHGVVTEDLVDYLQNRSVPKPKNSVKILAIQTSMP